MKRFKFGLVGLLVGLFGFISFGYCDTVSYYDPYYKSAAVPKDSTVSLSSGECITFTLTNCFTKGEIYNNNDDLIYSFNYNNMYDVFCVDFDGYYKNITNSSCSINIFSGLVKSCPECEECQECPEINTGDILSGSCDTNYCVENDLCPVPSNFSQLFINDIEHQSAPLINITIPEEYSWDSSVDSGQFDLVISGQNVDYEYIDGIIRTQKFTPDEEDFNNIITQIIPLLIPGLVIILFIYFIFRFIKKLF